MSSQQATVSNVPAELLASLLNTYAETVVLALFLYDYFLTLREEVEVVWRHNLAFHVGATSETPHHDAILHFVDAMAVLARTSILVTLTIRTYAVCGQNRIVLFGLGFIGMLAFTADCVQLSVDSLAMNLSKDNLDGRYTQLFNAIIRLIFEAAVIGLTLFQTLDNYRLQKGLNILEGRSLVWFILRNGSFYFITAFILELMNLASVYLSVENKYLAFETPFTLPIPALLMSRFILDLRYMNAHPNGSSHESVPLIPLAFASQPPVRSIIVDEPGDILLNQPVAKGINSEESRCCCQSEAKRFEDYPRACRSVESWYNSNEDFKTLAAWWASDGDETGSTEGVRSAKKPSKLISGGSPCDNNTCCSCGLRRSLDDSC